MKKQIILASASLWRRRLLKKHGISHKVHISNFEEAKHHEKPETLVVHNACGKASAVAKHYKNAIIIGVDTIGVLKGKIIGKPKDRAHAKRMIKTLSGTTHRVISGICIIDTLSGKKIKTKAVTKVTFRKISESELEKYLDSNHWKGKAGAYAIQGRAKGFVAKIEGDFTNVVGIPIDILKKIFKYQFSIFK